MANRLINQVSDFSVAEHNGNIIAPRPGNFFNVKNCDINYNLDLKYLQGYRNIKFTNCTFLHNQNFEDFDLDGSFDFIDCTFNEPVQFKNIKIKGKSRFWSTTFKKNGNFNNVRFEDLADFFKVIFSEIVTFYKVDFLGITVFTATHFKKNVLFTYSKLSDVTLFIKTNFGQGLDLSQAIITGKINFQNSDLPNFEDVKDIENDDDHREAFEDRGIITRNNQRETYRILKKISKDDSNQLNI